MHLHSTSVPDSLPSTDVFTKQKVGLLFVTDRSEGGLELTPRIGLHPVDGHHHGNIDRHDRACESYLSDGLLVEYIQLLDRRSHLGRFCRAFYLPAIKK